MWIASRYEFDRRRKSLTSSQLIMAITGTIIAAVLLVVVLLKINQESPLPGNIGDQVNFSILFPKSPWTVEESSITYNKSAAVVTMTAKNGAKLLTVTQQETLPQFNDIPEYFPALLGKLNEYKTIGTKQGTVHLTRPKEFNGATQAVLNTNGTLLFVYPRASMSVADWRQFFNSLHIVN